MEIYYRDAGIAYAIDLKIIEIGTYFINPTNPGKSGFIDLLPIVDPEQLIKR